MTIEDVQQLVDKVRLELANADNEGAHVAEDECLQATLRAIADGETDDPAGLAKAALEATMIDYARWYA